MFIKFSFFKSRIYKLKIALILTALLFVTGAHGDPITKNEVEDLNILISQVIGGQPNVLTILDLSGSMARNFGQQQLGNWDDAASAVQDCERAYCGSSCNTEDKRRRAAHCAENVANTSVCGSVNCENGTCETQEEFDNQVACVQTAAPSFNMTGVFNSFCGGPNASDCNTDTERAYAAAAMENDADLTQCGSAVCVGTCGDSTEYTNFKTCMANSQTITINQTANCTGGDTTCNGKPQFGSSRVDMALNVFFSILDADNSLDIQSCDDSSMLFDGVNTSISCKDYMETPFRDVSVHVKGTGSGFRLPITGASDTALIDELTNDDAEELGIRFRPMTYSGLGNWSSCTSNSTFRLPQGGFAGASKADLDTIWKFYRGSRGDGGTPLAYALGFDDNDASNSTIPNDALGAYRVELQTDQAISCRPEFVLVITDGEDTCSGECGVTSGSCSGSAVTNANRRSPIQAVSNLRTYNVRNQVQNRGENYKKEILTFVIGIGIENSEAIRTLNAMALAGGTHTTGVIRHTNPDGSVVGSVDIDTLLTGSGNQVYRDFAQALGIDSAPSNATLQGCLTPSESGICSFQGTNVFDNSFFSTTGPFDSTTKGLSYAFFVHTPEELITAIQEIFDFAETFSTSGVSPTAPQSSTSVALRDRIFLSVLTPIPDKRFWQGRLALYGFIPDPDNPSARIVVDNTSDRNIIFDDDGSLNEFAQNFHWEAGKELAESDPANRNLFTVDVDSSVVDIETDAGQVTGVRYTGDRVVFDDSLDPSFFGISDPDVTDPIPSFCTSGSVDEIVNCSTDCSDVTSSACRDCVKGCIRDRVVGFMSGFTEINPVGDPMGLPATGSQTASSIGYDCPDFESGLGGFTTCSVRLGDVFHSTPVVVGSPSPLFFDTGFQAFAKTFRDRTGAVYVGANDGFLHAFNAGDLINASFADPVTNPFTGETETVPFFSEGDGQELFAFAPPSFLPDAIAPSSKDPESPSGLTPPDYRFGDFKSFVVDNDFQRSFFDGSPLIADVWIDSDGTGTNGISNNSSCSSTISSLDGVIDECGKEWHTVLIAGYRNGGGAYTALDVTNIDRTQSGLKKLADGPDYPKHLWTIFDENFGNVWSDPTIGRVRMNTSDENSVDRWVMFVGGGLDPLDTDPTDGVDFGNAFYAIDIVTGQVIFKFHPDGSLTNDDKMVCDMPSKVGAFDLNADGYVDLVYEGDTCGRLWRFDVSMPIETSSGVADTGPDGSAVLTAPDWTGDIAFCANTASQCAQSNNVPTTGIQPIFFAPTVVLDDSGQRHVIFLTGNRREPSNASEYGKLYNFIDGFIPAYLAGGTAISASMKTEGDYSSGEIIDLVPQTGVDNQFTTSGGTDVQGEFIVNFPDNVGTPSGEKGFGAPVVISGVLVFTTFIPASGLADNPCSGGTGFGRIFALDYLSGQPALLRIPGAQGLLEGQSDAQKEAAAGLTVAQGMPTPAQLTFGARGSVVLTVAFTGSAATGGSQFLIWELPPFPSRTQTLFWEEIL